MAAGPKKIVLADLRAADKEHFFEFLVQNGVDFAGKGGNYIATVSVAKPVAGMREELLKQGSGVPLTTVPTTPRDGPRSEKAQILRRGLDSATPLLKRLGVIGSLIPLTEGSRANPGGSKPGSAAPVGKTAQKQNAKTARQSMLSRLSTKEPKPRAKVDGGPSTTTERSLDVDDATRNFCRFSSLILDDAPVERVKPMRPLQLLRLIEDVYEARYAQQLTYERACAAAVSIDDVKPLPRFPDFVLDCLGKQFGLRKIVKQNCWGLMASVMMLASAYDAVSLFGQFLDESLDPALDLVFFLTTRHAIAATAPTVSLKGKESFADAHIDAKQCISVVRSVTKDESYAELRKIILEQIDAAVTESLGDGISDVSDTGIKTSLILSVATEAYHTMRVEAEVWGLGSEELEETEGSVRGSISSHAEDYFESFRGSIVSHVEENHADEAVSSFDMDVAIKDLRPDEQDKLRKTALKLIDNLQECGQKIELQDAVDFAIKTAVLDSQPPPRIPEYSMRLEDVHEAATYIHKASAIASERERVLALYPNEFEEDLEANVRQLLLAVTEELAAEAVAKAFAHGDRSAAEEAAVQQSLLEEFALTADRLMEALVNGDYDSWHGLLGISTAVTDRRNPGELQCRRHFNQLHGEFKEVVRGTVDAHAVDGICKSVVNTPEFRGLLMQKAMVHSSKVLPPPQEPDRAAEFDEWSPEWSP
jgi:hypothetical protein